MDLGLFVSAISGLLSNLLFFFFGLYYRLLLEEEKNLHSQDSSSCLRD